MPRATPRRARHAADSATDTVTDTAASVNQSAGLVGDVAKFLITRSVLTRFARVGGIQGMLLSAAATYALNRYLGRRR